MHVLMMLLYSAMTAIVFAAIESRKDSPRDRVVHGLKVFAAFMGVGLLLAWVLFPIPW